MTSFKVERPIDAYLVGWLVGNGIGDGSRTRIEVNAADADILLLLRGALEEAPEVQRARTSYSLDVGGTVFFGSYSKAFKKLFREGESSNFLDEFFPDNEELKWVFLRGCVDASGDINRTTSCRKEPLVKLSLPFDINDSVVAFSQTAKIKENSLVWEGNNALDFLGKLYDSAEFCLERNRGHYLEWCSYHPSFASGTFTPKSCMFKWKKLDDRAVAPSKTNVSDSGYDLVLIEKIKQSGNVEFYTTGVAVSPGFGWAFDLVGRSSISKSGYMLANNVGIIDRTYQGPLIAALIKVDPDAPELELPSKLVQIVPRTIAHLTPVEVPRDDDFDGVSSRAAGGFGSTGS